MNELTTFADRIRDAKTTTDLEIIRTEINQNTSLTVDEVDTTFALLDAAQKKLNKAAKRRAKKTDVPVDVEQVGDQVFTADTSVDLGFVLREKFAMYPAISLRALAHATNTSYPKLMYASKQPQPGQVYDPTQWNADRIAFVLGAEKIEMIDWDQLNTDCSMRRRPGTSGTVRTIENYHVDDVVWLRRDNDDPFRIALITSTHIVLQSTNILDKTVPVVMNHNTFFLSGPMATQRPQKEVD